MKDSLPACAYMHAHPEVVRRVCAIIPDNESLNALSELYRVFGDCTRIRILYALLEEEMCVCDIAQLLSMNVSAISHQLRVLKSARLIRYRRDGKTVFYSLADDHVRTMLAQGMEHIHE